MRKRSIKNKFKQKVVRKIRTEKTNKTLFERVFCSLGPSGEKECNTLNINPNKINYETII